MVAQLIGAVVAAALVGMLFPSSVPSTAGLPALNADMGIDLVKGTIIEAVLTMLLLAAVFGTAVDLRAARIGGLAIGLAITAGIIMGGNLTGAAINPARWFGPALIAGDFTNALVWIVGPLAGAAIIALIYRGLFLPEAERLGAPEAIAPGRRPSRSSERGASARRVARSGHPTHRLKRCELVARTRRGCVSTSSARKPSSLPTSLSSALSDAVMLSSTAPAANAVRSRSSRCSRVVLFANSRVTT